MSSTEYIFPPQSDQGTVIEPDQVAVTYDDKVGYAILMPGDDSVDLPEQAVVLVAAAMRLREDEMFYKDLVEWFEARQNELGEEDDE